MGALRLHPPASAGTAAVLASARAQLRPIPVSVTKATRPSSENLVTG